jgi:HlyD family secretion protein
VNKEGIDMKWKKGKFGTILGVFVIGAILGILIYVIVVPRPVEVETAKVSIGLFQQTIRADGVLRSKERYIVPAHAEGDIKRISLKIGDPIKKGEEITELFWDVKFDPVRAPISGVISKIYRESSGPIRRGEPIVEIVDPTRLEVMAELLTTDAVRLRAGGQAWIENWSGGQPIEAKVKRVSKAGFTKQSALGVEEERTEVTADLLNVPLDALERVGSTFHVDVTFNVSETANAIKVPVGSLLRDGSDWAVYLAEEGRAKKKKVMVEALGSREASIKSGLVEGQLLLVYPGDLVKEGTRIRAKTTSDE